MIPFHYGGCKIPPGRNRTSIASKMLCAITLNAQRSRQDSNLDPPGTHRGILFIVLQELGASAENRTRGPTLATWRVATTPLKLSGTKMLKSRVGGLTILFLGQQFISVCCQRRRRSPPESNRETSILANQPSPKVRGQPRNRTGKNVEPSKIL